MTYSCPITCVTNNWTKKQDKKIIEIKSFFSIESEKKMKWNEIKNDNHKVIEQVFFYLCSVAQPLTAFH